MFLLIPMLIKSQHLKNQLGTCYMFNTTHEISESFSLKNSAHIRFFELAQVYQQEIYRVGLFYNVNEHLNITGGMVYSVKEDNYKKPSNKTYEYRYYEDFNWKTSFNNLRINSRIRLEHSINNNEISEKFNHRIRFGATLQYPILKNTTLYLFDEVFFDVSDRVLSENRTGFGLTNNISEVLKFQLGYMHTHQINTFSKRLQDGLLINTDLRKKTS